MRVAIVGSRSGVDLDQVQAFVRRLADEHPHTIVVSGGAPGVDRAAEGDARDFGLSCEVIPANWSTGNRLAGKERNWELVDSVDEVVAFWDGWSNGTAHAVTAATHLGKRVWVYCERGGRGRRGG